MNNPGIELDFTNPDYPAQSLVYDNPHFDFYCAGEWRNDLGYGTTAGDSTYYLNTYKNANYNTRFGPVNFGSSSNLRFNGLSMPFGMYLGGLGHADSTYTPNALLDIRNKDLLVADWSNYRYSPTGVFGIGNTYENKPLEYYVYGSKDVLQDNTNLQDYRVD